MEDILASIRRIISDDHVNQSRSGAGATQPPQPPAQAQEPRAVPVVSPRTSDRVAPFPRGAPGDLLELPRHPSPVVARSGASPSLATGRASFAYGGEVVAAVPASDAAPVHEAPQHQPREPAPSPHPEAQPASAPAPILVSSRFAEASGGLDGGVRVVASVAERATPATDESASSDALLSPPLGASVMSAFETLAASVVLRNEAALTATMREMLRPLLKAWLDDHLPTLVERLVRAEIERVARGGRG